MRARLLAGFIASLLLLLSPAAVAQTARTTLSGEPIRISRATGPITIDGDLSDEAWQHATRVEKWYEVTPGDNVEPKVKSVAYLTYDDRFLYVAFDLSDPDPSAVRAPLGDHDSLNGGSDDFVGIFLDTLNTGRTATEFFVSARNVQYDAVTDDASSENSSPDFFWDSATRITTRGWVAEIRLPFSSLRYKNADPQTWGILLFRNYPHGFRYQIASTRLPRGGNCLVCRFNRLDGLERLPAGGHLVAAPYVNAGQTASPAGDVLGAPLVNGDIKPKIGVDVKYTPNADNALDFTVKPDFSQVESDTAQISANERFALFFPEKRPFFLEGVDLFQTPIQAVYTIRYTALVADDAGGGSAILPGPNGSSFASQDFGSTVLLARAKRDIGLSFVGVLVTDRENRDGDGHNRVAGPDFQWRLSPRDVVTGQVLFSDSRTPSRPDLADEWTAQRLSGHALNTYWNHNTTHLDWSVVYKDLGAGFRADAGFVPQVGYREYFGGGGWQVYPKGLVARERTFVFVDYQADQAGAVITRDVQPGFGMDTRGNGFLQFRYVDNRTRAGGGVVGRRQFGYIINFNPSRRVTFIGVNGTLGQDIDFANARPGRGPTVNASATLHPTDHLELGLIEDVRTLSVDDGAGSSRRLFTQHVSRVKGTYTFTSRMFARVIAQYVSTTRDPSLYASPVAAQSGDFGGSEDTKTRRKNAKSAATETRRRRDKRRGAGFGGSACAAGLPQASQTGGRATHVR
ncbi:MAG: carbohydrate binding family 9 domain-containing protein [Acidobacteria bacterium]|nr:carbohydrate binding family 9 domain-containing protein [Acidobacteriota bacterium]